MTLNPSYFHASQGGQQQPGLSAPRQNEARPRRLQGYIKESDQESTSWMFNPGLGDLLQKSLPTNMCITL